MAAAIGSAFVALRVAQEPRRDFDCEPQRPPPITLPRLLGQHCEPSMQAPRADRLPFPGSPTAQSENAPSIRSCSQADDDAGMRDFGVQP